MVIKMEKHTKKKSLTNKKKDISKRFAICLQIQIAYNPLVMTISILNNITFSKNFYCDGNTHTHTH